MSCGSLGRGTEVYSLRETGHRVLRRLEVLHFVFPVRVVQYIFHNLSTIMETGYLLTDLLNSLLCLLYYLLISSFFKVHKRHHRVSYLTLFFSDCLLILAKHFAVQDLSLLCHECSPITSLYLSFVVARHTSSDSSLRAVLRIFHVDELGPNLEISRGGSLAPVV
jgi:hypothetical protein